MNATTNNNELTFRLLAQKIKGHSYADSYAACSALESAYGLTTQQRRALSLLIREEYPG